MAKNVNNLSLASHGLKYKLKISFYLMSILPLLVCGYLVSNYILPRFGLSIDIALSLLISVVIAFFGFFVIKEVFDRVLSVTSEARLIAAGDYSRKLEIEGTVDEVGDLGESLNLLTQQIRSNMDELKGYGEKTTQINIEIQKRVMVLSSLLQISSVISQSTKLEDSLKLIVEKSRLLANSESAYLLFREEERGSFYMKEADGSESADLMKVVISPKEELNKAFSLNKPVIIDSENTLEKETKRVFFEKFRLKNSLALPVYLKGKIIAVLGVGNSVPQFKYKKEEVELLDIFAKQIAIAIENDTLLRRVEKLEIKDALTGLYNDVFIRSRLQEEIKRAITYQRPCSFVLFDIDNFKSYCEFFGSLQAESELKKIASLMKNSVTDIDRVARVGDDEFAMLLPEKNKRQALDIAASVRKKIEYSSLEETDPRKKVTVSAGISENPLDGVEAKELIDKAEALLKLAKFNGKNRVAAF